MALAFFLWPIFYIIIEERDATTILEREEQEFSGMLPLT
jgi:hypothetical protein